MALPLVCRACLFSRCVSFIFVFSLSLSVHLFSLLISRVGATMDRACLTTIKGRPRDARVHMSRALLKKSIKRRIITEEGVSTHGIYDVLVHCRCYRFTAAAVATMCLSTGCPPPGLGSVRTGTA